MAVALLAACCAMPAAAWQPGDLAGKAWKTGPALERQLAAEVGVQWSGRPLREALASLAESQGVAVFLDRRVDPGQALDLQFGPAPLREVLQYIAADRGLGFAMLGPVAYFGPAESAGQIRTLAELARDAVAKLPAERRGAWLRPRSWRWEMLAEPGRLLAELEQEAGVEIAGQERVPHDLWPATDLPPLPLTDRLTLIAVGFGLQPVVGEDGGVALRPIEGQVRLVRSYSAGAAPAQVAQRLASLLPEAEFRAADGKLYVRGRLEDHEQVAAALAGQPIKRPSTASKEPAAGRQVFTLRVENQPLGPVLRHLAERLQLTLKLDDPALRAAGVDLEQRVSFAAEQASLDELLTAALAPAGLTYRRDGNTVTVVPK